MNRPHQSKAELAMRKAVKLRPTSGGERFAAVKAGDGRAAEAAQGLTPARPAA